MPTMIPEILGKGPYRFPLSSNLHLTQISFQAIKVDAPVVEFREATPPDTPTSQQQGERIDSSRLKIMPLDGEIARLHMPLGYAVNDQLNYSNANLGPFGGAIVAGLNSGNGISASLYGALKETGQSIFNLFDAFSGSGQEVGRLAALRASRVLPSTLGGAAIRLAARVSIHPNLRTQFDDVAIRNFTFNFRFVPESIEESRAVKNIIQFFRFHSYPIQIPNGESFAIGYEYPNMFKIKLQANIDGQTKNIGTPIKLSYLTNVKHTYNSNSTSVFSDGSPTEVDLELTFAEYKALSRRDVYHEDNKWFYDLEQSSEQEIPNSNNQAELS